MAGPRLTVFAGPDSQGDVSATDVPSGRWTLPEFYFRWARPSRMAARSAGSTMREYDQLFGTAGHWARATGNPPIAAITAETLEDFADHLARQPGKTDGSTLSAATRRKLMTYAQKMLGLAGPRVQCERSATKRGLYDADEDGDPIFAPRFSHLGLVPRAESDVPDPFEVDELQQILDWLGTPGASEAVMRPRIEGVEPAAWWQTWVIVQYETGQRRGSLLQAEYSMLKQDRSGRWMLRQPAAICKGGQAIHCYVSPQALEAIERIRTERPQIFPWDCGPRHFDTVWHRVLGGAKLPADRRLGTHAIRKASGTQLALINPAAGVQQLGHSAEIAWRHYRGREVVAAASQRMARPRRTPKPDPAQLTLF